MAVVFDNYQTVPNQAPFHAVLAQGLSEVPAGISVIVLSRANPPPARLQTEQRMTLIGEDDLWLTAAEATRLTWALEFAREVNTKLIEFIGLVIRADRALQTGDEAAGLVALRAALAIGAETEFFYPMLPGRSAWPLLCATALDAGIEPAYVKRLIRIMRLAPEGPARSCAAWPWPVKVTTLGRFKIDGKRLAYSRKAPRQLLAVLQVLVAGGKERLPVATVMDALWPDSDGDAAYRSLAYSLSRLRKLLQHEAAVTLAEGHVRLDPSVVWTDVAAFERLAQQALEAEQGGRWHDAQRLTERALQVDPSVEAWYQDLIMALVRRERYEEAHQAYQRCRSALTTLLDRNPSQDTTTLLNDAPFSPPRDR